MLIVDLDALVTFAIYCGDVINLLEHHRLCDAVCIAMRIRSSSGGRQPINCLDHPQLQQHDKQALMAGDPLSDTSSENPDLSENCFGSMHNICSSAA